MARENWVDHLITNISCAYGNKTWRLSQITEKKRAFASNVNEEKITTTKKNYCLNYSVNPFLFLSIFLLIVSRVVICIVYTIHSLGNFKLFQSIAFCMRYFFHNNNIRIFQRIVFMFLKISPFFRFTKWKL